MQSYFRHWGIETRIQNTHVDNVDNIMTCETGAHANIRIRHLNISHQNLPVALSQAGGISTRSNKYKATLALLLQFEVMAGLSPVVMQTVVEIVVRWRMSSGTSKKFRPHMLHLLPFEEIKRLLPGGMQGVLVNSAVSECFRFIY